MARRLGVTVAGAVCLAGTVLGLAGPAPSGSVRLSWDYDGCRVSTSHYVLRFDIMDPPLFRLFAPDSTRELLSFGGLWLLVFDELPPGSGPLGEPKVMPAGRGGGYGPKT